MHTPESTPAILALEDGTVYTGTAFGAPATVVGEAVFNTSMTGYQEIITDPSYNSQIVTLTAPQIGNTGINLEDIESTGGAPQVSALIVRELSPVVSNWRATSTLEAYLAQHGIPGLAGVDTRALTKKLRTAGVMKACLSTEAGLTPEAAVEKARAWEGLAKVDCIAATTCTQTYAFEGTKGEDGGQCAPFTVVGTDLYAPHNAATSSRPRFKVAALHLGAKQSIFKQLAQHGLDVTVFPATATAEELLATNPQGIFLSNGPGDPATLENVHAVVKTLLAHTPAIPLFGICLGHQILTHALGGDTFKLKFGHRGGNQPVKNTETDTVRITAQNHGYATCPESLEGTPAIVTELNLNDGTVAGLRHESLPVFSVQYHPEAGPGPNDAHTLFEDFYQLVAKHAG